MSDEMNWGQTPQEGSDNRENSQTEQEKTYQPEKPAAHPYSAARYSQTEHDSTQETPPRYEHYQFGQGQKDYQGTGTGPEKKTENHGSFSKKLGTTVALAVVFGLVSASIFQGVNLAVDKYTGKSNNSQQVATTKTVTASDASDTAEAAVSGKGTVAEVAQASMPSVVAITSVSVQEIPNIFGGYFGYGGTQQYQSAGSGSGIIVGENDSELLIATNNHVVEGATTLSVCFIGSDVVNAEEETQNLVNEDGDINVEDAVTAKIKGTDPDNDLAVVAVQKSDIPEDTMSEIKIAQLGNSDSLDVGEQVVAIGNALGYGQSVTSGWISALNRSVTLEDGNSSDLIQTDAAINPGNSGGALLNMSGELIGINSAKYADAAVEGMGYAIPISKAQPILEDLMNRETREKVSDQDAAYMGVQLTDLSSEAIQMYNMPAGAFVMEAIDGEAAQAAGIQKGDIIVKLDGQKVSDRADLMDKLQYYASGETVEVVVARANNGEYDEQTIEVTLGSKPASEE